MITKLLLAVLQDAGFALAGSGAIREHGLTSRRTADVDLFTLLDDFDRFDAAVTNALTALQAHGGYAPRLVRRGPLFARFDVELANQVHVEVDLGVDWRAEEPTLFDVGPVLAIEDAVANKVGALYSRGEIRDYLDVDQIRQSGRFSDEALLELVEGHDPGFERQRFARQLADSARLDPRQVAQYEVSPTQLAAIQTRLSAWARSLNPGRA